LAAGFSAGKGGFCAAMSAGSGGNGTGHGNGNGDGTRSGTRNWEWDVAWDWTGGCDGHASPGRWPAETNRPIDWSTLEEKHKNQTSPTPFSGS